VTIVSTTRTTADAALKEDYLPGARETLNSHTFLLSVVEQNTEDVEGRRAVLAINTGRNEGVGARAEGGTLPTAGTQGWSEERIPLAYNYGSIKLSGPVIKSMGSDRGSFVRAVDSEMRGVVRDLKNDVNRQTFQQANSTIAQCDTTTAATQVELATSTLPFQMRQLRVGMFIDIGTIASPASVASNRQIEAVTGTDSIEISGAAVTTDSTHFITRTGSGGNEITGLKDQVAASGTLWNIDPATVTTWVSTDLNNSGTPRAVSEELFIQGSQDVNIASGEEVDLWVSGAGVHRKTALLLTSDKRFPTSNVMRGGYTGLDMSAVMQGNSGANEVMMTWDKDCDDDLAYGLTTSRFQCYKMSDWEFMDEDGAVLNRVSGEDAYEATLFCYHELATDNRAAHVVIKDLIYA
jgi:hypothetical protein